MAQSYPPVFDVNTLNGANGFAVPGIEVGSQLGAETKFIGDINNDGLEDIAIGVSNATVNGLVGAGITYVIFGTSLSVSANFDVSTLNGVNGFILEGIVEWERRGHSVTGPGDLNGDGIDDLVVLGNGGSLVLYGKTTTFNAQYSLTDINGSNGFIIDINLVNEVASLGDVNGDGFNDFILGNGAGGQARVLFGRSTNFPASIDSSWLDGTNGFRTSSFSGTRPAFNVGGAGDINNDGYDDILIGNWDSIDPAISYLLFGKGTPFNALVDLPSLNGTDGFSIDNNGGGFLTFVGTLGDINNDGIDDFFSENDVILGTSSPFPASLLMTDLNGSNGFVLENYVLCAAPTGDLNFDGIADFIVAAADDYVVFGTNTGFPSAFDPSTLNGVNGFQIPNINNSNIGRPIDGGKDFNGDGLSDFIIGSPLSGTGIVYVIFGGDHYTAPDTEAPVITCPINQELTCNTASIPDYTGMATVTDNEDPTPTLTQNPAVGTAFVDGMTITMTATDASGNSNNCTFIVNTAADTDKPILTCLTSESLFVNSTLPNYYLKLGVSDNCTSLFDLTYTQTPVQGTVFTIDTNVTVTVIDGNGNTESCSFLVTVRSPIAPIDCTTTSIRINDLDGSNGFQIDGNRIKGETGYDVRGAGDVNGDGIEDFLVGSPGKAYNFNSSYGRERGNFPGDVFVIFGKGSDFLPNLDTALLDGSNGFKITNDIPGGSFQFSGYQVSTAGDINNDGIDDLMFSDPFRNDGLGPELGTTYVVFGKTSGFPPVFNVSSLDGTNGFVFMGTDAYDQSALSFDSAGDINNDGINDIIIGARTARFTDTSGKCYIVYGSSTAFPALLRGSDLNGTNGFIIKGDADGEGIGSGVVGLGDVNGDGIDDVGFEGGYTNKTYVLFGKTGGFSNIVPTATINGTTGFYADVSSLSSSSFHKTIMGVGDVNDDGINDILFGNKRLFFGKNTSFSVAEDITSLDGTNGVEFTGNNYKISSAGGDFNNDGVGDLIVGQSGSIAIVYGKNTPWSATLSPFSLPSSEGFVVSRSNSRDYSVSNLGDINGDGITDVIIGEKERLYYDSGSSLDPGHAHVIYGFSISDTEPPVITCPSDQILASGNVLPDYTTLAAVTDNCDAAPVITQNPTIGGTYTSGMTITLIATDLKGNTANCTFIVSDNTDTVPPSIICPSDQELVCNTTSIPDYTGLATATDTEDPNPVITQNPAIRTAFVDGMTITMTATDASGNSNNCTFIVNTAVDTEAPVVTCPSSQNLPAGATLPDYTSLVSVTDNCESSFTIVQSPATGAPFTNGMTITMTVTDTSNNVGNCTFIITKTPDTEAPVITCPNNQELTCNTASIPDYTGLTTVTDNEDPTPTLTQNLAVGTAFVDGMTITMTATDASNNSTACYFVLNEQSVAINAGIDVDITEGQEVQLNAIATDSGSFVWSPSIGLNNTNIPYPMATPTETTTYTVLFTSIDGCTAEDEITIFVEAQQLEETKYGFSPDHDGINEFWKIGGIENYPNNSVFIYNRWGDLVFKIEGYNNTSRVFSGIANRKRHLGADELPEGTYFFNIKIEGIHSLKKMNGFIVLKR